MSARRDIALLSFLAAAQLWWIGPAQLYADNSAEFEFGFGSGLLVLSVGLLLHGSLLLAIGWLSPRRWARAYALLLLWFVGTAWVQFAFLRVELGGLRGEPVDWAAHRTEGMVGLIVWILLGVVVVVARRALSRALGWLASLLLLSQLVVSGWAVRSHWRGPADAQPVFLAEASSSANIFHVLLDGLRTDSFVEQVESRGWAGNFAGFVCFRDNLAAAPVTSLALPAIFSGDIYDGSTVPAAYHRRSMGERSFTNRLFDAGWRVHLTPRIRMVESKYHSYRVTPTRYSSSPSSQKRDQALLLASIAWMRLTPTLAQRFVHRDEDWLLLDWLGEGEAGVSARQRAFLRDFGNALRAESEQPVYQFLHLMPPHPPFSTLANGEDAGHTLPHTLANYESEVRYTLEAFLGFLERLRELGIYDESLIVLQSDHGHAFADENANRDMYPRAQALMALKLPGAGGELRYTDAPSSSADLAATILELVGVKSDLAGTPLTGIDGERDRFFVRPSGESGEEAVTRYLVRGPIRDGDSWTELGQELIDVGDPTYEYGAELRFRLNDDVERYLPRGWCARGSGYRRSCERRADIVLDVAPSQGDCLLHLDLRAILNDEVRAQTVRIYCDGVFLGKAELADEELHGLQMQIPAEFSADGRMELTLRLPNAFPRHAGAEQLIGIALYRLVIEEAAR